MIPYVIEFPTNIYSFRGADFAYLKEYEDVQLTAFLSTMTKGLNSLNDVRILLYSPCLPIADAYSCQLVDKHTVLTSGRDDRGFGGPRRRGTGRAGPMGDWDRMH